MGIPPQYVVAIGNVVDGLVLYGPFLCFQDAEAWIEDNEDDEAWVIIEVLAPEEGELTEVTAE